MDNRAPWWLIAYRTPFFVLWGLGQSLAALAVLFTQGLDAAVKYLTSQF